MASLNPEGRALLLDAGARTAGADRGRRAAARRDKRGVRELAERGRRSLVERARAPRRGRRADHRNGVRPRAFSWLPLSHHRSGRGGEARLGQPDLAMTRPTGPPPGPGDLPAAGGANPIEAVRARRPSDLDEILSILEEAARWLASRGIAQWEPGTFSRRRISERIGRGEAHLFLSAVPSGSWSFSGPTRRYGARSRTTPATCTGLRSGAARPAGGSADGSCPGPKTAPPRRASGASASTVLPPTGP